MTYRSPIAVSFLVIQACVPSNDSQDGVASPNLRTRPEAASRADGRWIVFSPSSRQTDFHTRFAPSMQASWDALAPAYDVLNLHAADIIGQSDAYLTEVAQRVRGKPIALELQSTAGLLHFGLQNQSPCEGHLDVHHAAACGQMAADAWFHTGSSGLGLSRVLEHGLNVQYILIDSAFYAPYLQLRYVDAGGTRDRNRHEAKMKALYFMDGFMTRLKGHEMFGPNLKFIFISHFKYESVGQIPGFKNRVNGARCFNTCAGGPWIQEEQMVDFVLTNLPGRFEMVLFDVSWSSFSVTASPWARWDTMIAAVQKHGVRVGNIVHTDGPWGGECSGLNHECWFAPANGCHEEQAWHTHMMSYLDVIHSGGGGLLQNHGVIDGMMIASWHRLPEAAFHETSACNLPLEDIVRCAAAVDGRPVSCPAH